MLKLVKNLVVEEDGQGMVEYGLILALISVVAIVALTSIGSNLLAKFQGIAAELAK